MENKFNESSKYLATFTPSSKAKTHTPILSNEQDDFSSNFKAKLLSNAEDDQSSPMKTPTNHFNNKNDEGSYNKTERRGNNLNFSLKKQNKK